MMYPYYYATEASIIRKGVLMNQGKSRKIMIVLLGIYTILTFFFLFIGFNRSSINDDQGLRFNFIFEGIPLHFLTGRYFHTWFFDLGNFLAFVPFGIVIPLLYRCRFIRFISLFILSITIIEAIQMVSRLGAFDINDIIINTLGAAVGYWSQHLAKKQHHNPFKELITIAFAAILLTSGTYFVVGGINYYLDHVDGEVVALNELMNKEGTVQSDESLEAFTTGVTSVKPQINLYTQANINNNEITFLLNGNYDKIEGYVALPDNAVEESSYIKFFADGSEIWREGPIGNEPNLFRASLQGATELTIELFDDEVNPNANVVMWDVTLTEVNKGQRFINMIKSLF